MTPRAAAGPGIVGGAEVVGGVAQSRRRRSGAGWWRWAALGLVAAASGPAHAGDALRPRVPVVHLGERCLTVIDRSATPVVHLDYTFPLEDTCAGAQPAPLHQFVAFCRPLAPGQRWPEWISQADVEAARAQDIPLFPIAVGDVLADDPTWSSCWWRITPDEERRPLTCDAAREGVDWDVSALAPGPYVVAGYTHQPPRSLWSPRWGAFKVSDGPDPADGPPVAALAQREAFVHADEVVDLGVCVSAMDGATLELELALHDDAPEWQVLATGVPVTGATVDVSWTPPPAVLGADVRLRVTVTDPQGRTGTLESPELLHVLAVPLPNGGDGEPAPDDPPADPPDMCRDSDAPPQAVSCPTEPETTDADTDADGSETAAGCGCRRAPRRLDPGWAWCTCLLVAGACRRRAATCR